MSTETLCSVRRLTDAIQNTTMHEECVVTGIWKCRTSLTSFLAVIRSTRVLYHGSFTPRGRSQPRKRFPRGNRMQMWRMERGGENRKTPQNVRVDGTGCGCHQDEEDLLPCSFPVPESLCNFLVSSTNVLDKRAAHVCESRTCSHFLSTL